MNNMSTCDMITSSCKEKAPMKTRDNEHKYSDANFFNFLNICHQTASCLEYTLQLDTHLCESSFANDNSGTDLISSVLAMTYEQCFSKLVLDNIFFGQSNPNTFPPCSYSTHNLEDIDDPFWNSIYSQCILSTYDTIVQLLNDTYLSISGLMGVKNTEKKNTSTPEETIAPKGVHINYKSDTGKVEIPNTKCDTLLERPFRTNIQDRTTYVYLALLKNEDALKYCGVDLFFYPSIDYDNNYHRLALPNNTFMRYFTELPINFHFKFKLEGPECVFEEQHEPHMFTSNDTKHVYTWETKSLDRLDFPYARELGKYTFSLTIIPIKRTDKNQSDLQKPTFCQTISISKPVKKKDKKQKQSASENIETNIANDADINNNTSTDNNVANNTSEPPLYIDFPSYANKHEEISALEYFPMNLFNQSSKKRFLFYNADFYSYFMKKSPSSTYDILSMLCSGKSNKKLRKDDHINFSKLKDSDFPENLPQSNDPIDQLYFAYQFERMISCNTTNDLYDLEKKLFSIDVSINNEELDTFCKLAASRTVFSRNFLLAFVLYPLIKKESFYGSSLLTSVTNDNTTSFPKNSLREYSRELWHFCTKMFLAQWNNLYVPACEWFFLLSLLRSYGIDFNSYHDITTIDQSATIKTLKEKMANLYKDLSTHIKNNYNEIKNPTKKEYDELLKKFPSKDTSNKENASIPYKPEKIMHLIARNNKTRMPDLGSSDDETVILNSLVYFNKDTVLRTNNEKNRRKHFQQIRDMYVLFQAD